MVAELGPSDPLPELAIGGIHEFGALEVNHVSLEVHAPIPIEDEAGLFPYKKSLSYFARYQYPLHIRTLMM